MSDDMDKYYDQRAPEYEQIYYRDNAERQDELKQAREQLLDLAAGRRVLDLACGTGYWTQVASQTAAEVVALDQSMGMIIEARKKEYVCPVEFVQGDLYAHGLKPDSFDLVLLCFWLSHHSRADFGRLFAPLIEPARASAKIWLIDNNPPAESSVNQSLRIDEHGNNYKYRYLDDGTRFVIMKNYFSETELRSLFPVFADLLDLQYGHYYWMAELQKRS